APGHQAFDDLRNLRMHQRFAAGNADHGRAALIYRAETFFRAELLFEDVSGILDLAASGARKIAAEQRFQHQYQRIAPASGELLLQHVARDGPHLGYRYSQNASKDFKFEILK